MPWPPERGAWIYWIAWKVSSDGYALGICLRGDDGVEPCSTEDGLANAVIFLAIWRTGDALPRNRRAAEVTLGLAATAGGHLLGPTVRRARGRAANGSRASVATPADHRNTSAPPESPRRLG